MLPNSDSIGSPSESIALTGILFIAVEVVKPIFGITGDTRRIRTLTLILAMILSFGDAIVNPTVPNTAPHNAHYWLAFVWSAALRALQLAFAAFGAHAVRNTITDNTTLPENPVAATNFNTVATNLNTAAILAADPAIAAPAIAAPAPAAPKTVVPGSTIAVEPPIVLPPSIAPTDQVV